MRVEVSVVTSVRVLGFPGVPGVPGVAGGVPGVEIPGSSSSSKVTNGWPDLAVRTGLMVGTENHRMNLPVMAGSSEV